MRSGLSSHTTPVFRAIEPGGTSWSINARFSTGPLTSSGCVGNRPLLGPGSTLSPG